MIDASLMSGTATYTGQLSAGVCTAALQPTEGPSPSGTPKQAAWSQGCVRGPQACKLLLQTLMKE